MEQLIARRTVDRRISALRCALAAMPALHTRGIEAYVIGSLASGRFMPHSDVDFLVTGHLDPMERRAAEAMIARTMAGGSVGYDVVYEEDIKEDLLEGFRYARADPSRLLELAHQADAA